MVRKSVFNLYPHPRVQIPEGEGEGGGRPSPIQGKRGERKEKCVRVHTGRRHHRHRANSRRGRESGGERLRAEEQGGRGKRWVRRRQENTEGNGRQSPRVEPFNHGDRQPDAEENPGSLYR